jgi:ABC-type Zn uptake system ZnuABC Zn-binding protein ZnuA
MRIFACGAHYGNPPKPPKGRVLTAPISRRRLFATVSAAGILVVWPSLRAVGSEPASGWSDELDDDGRLNVATTVAPISSIVRNIGGARVNLRGIVPDGADSHTFEPAPSDAKILASARLLIANGLDLETPTIELAEGNMPDGSAIFTLGDRTIEPEQYAYDFSFPKDAGHPNPHLWTNVPYAMRYAELAQGRLAEVDSASSDYYAANLALYRTSLERLDQAIHSTVETIPESNRKLLTYHDSWAYFAPNYGMTVIGAIQPSDFSEPSPRDVADLIDQIRKEDIQAIFGSEVFPSDVLEQIADETGAEYVDDLRDDAPPGEPGSPEHTYIGMMKRNLEIMARALGGDPGAMAAIDPADTFLN